MKNLLLTLLVSFGLTMATLAQLPSSLPTSGLIGYWPFNGNANDESGSGNNGTVHGATLTIDRFGNLNSAYDFDGISSHISLNNSICNFGTSDFTISAWLLKYDTLVSGTVVGKRNSTGNGNMLNFFSRPGYEISTGTLNDYTNTSWVKNYQVINSWFHTIFIRSGNNLKLYLNGVLIDDYISPTIHNISNSAITEIGARYSGSEIWNLWHGIIDDVGIWNRSLSDNEIRTLYTMNNGNVGVNTTNPKRNLHINNVMRLEPRYSSPSNPSEGDIYYDAVIHKLRVYDGTTWQNCW